MIETRRPTSSNHQTTLLAIAGQLREQAAELEREAIAAAPAATDLGDRDWSRLLNRDLGADLDAPDPADDGVRLEADGLAFARRAVLAARFGQLESALLLAARAEGAPGASTESMVGVALARTLVALTDGRPGDAYEGLLAFFANSRDRETDGLMAPLMGIFAEAGLRARKPHEAQYVFRQWTSRVGHDVSDPRNTEPFVAETLLQMGDTSVVNPIAMPGEGLPAMASARLQLAHGMWLRRSRRTVEARAHLLAAQASFSSPGGTPWRALCDSELAAAAMTHRSTKANELLSGQQLAIARLVADGLSNREIALRLCLSPRTVSSHLYRIFPALGISSRAQLAAALASVPPDLKTA